MRPIIIGITGGIASGKSTISKALQQEGYSVISTDKIGHEVLLYPEIKNKLTNEFGNEILENNRVNRDLLREIVFEDKNKVDKLNKIVHPEILDTMDDIVKHSSSSICFSRYRCSLKLILKNALTLLSWYTLKRISN